VYFTTQDKTYPDGSVLQPGQPFAKTWLLRNDGDIPFPANSWLRLVGGDAMGSLDTGAMLPLCAPGDTFEVTVYLLAPLVEGRCVLFVLSSMVLLSYAQFAAALFCSR
jgi:Ig-like domain from next to BRCA1 gene